MKLPQVNFIDKILHFSAYFALTLSWQLAFYKSVKLKIKESLIIVAVFFYGIIIEVLQGALTSYRQADLLDIIANFIGIIIAWAFFRGFFFKNRMK
ncbi:MAG: VanZ family protein [Lutibacter sp.]|nr:VanZ family protein [Lutibacter sp.]NNJ57319.1 VanZ family protein [Lutibacter sp.]